ncbi:lysophospholipid acyltransferase family protein [Nocardioides sp.]|uniref:lysophospholipid acyltransferase family protein n=1 Tax=Nocardioides sp. TaxID=35761 RepID=UPI002BAE4F5E|nr:lysophospholipid acyltransferase family protein [Nocardioides sp.]HSX66396.1 lysophospholipid acyltransferase family protein [Nocardioides sp.]
MTVRKLPRKRGVGWRFAEVAIKPVLVGMSRRQWTDGLKIPAEGGVILVANHVTKIDPLTIAHYVHDHGRMPRFLAKAGLWDVPVVGWLARSTKQVPVARMSADAVGAFNAAIEALREGECIVVYPEGTVTRDPGLWPMRGKTGAARMALESGAPVVPVAHWGEQEILAPYAKAPRLFPRATVQVRAGDPIDLADLCEGEVTREKIDEATDRIMAALTTLVAELRGQPAPAERFDPKAAGVAEIGNPHQKKRKKDQA